ncbi:hypothetical protein [Rhizobium sp. NXC24]|uniref:phage adaptor protein n=1 Tax=Rhizobium sp. NXC24 TaxID=2048897 RepID=UPI000CDF46C7|nr:hypothetical protein [Rhizobium sp. NXC24]AVA22470.1 hypothetical protein NXC24_CH02840 [Rhizobium sp. NXC24]
MSLLTIIQNVCAELSLAIPGLVMGSPDPMTTQLRILCQRAGDDLARDHDWSILLIQRTFTATGAMPEPAEPPADWERFTDNSVIWNNSRLWQLNGPVDPWTWQRNLIINSNPVPQLWRMIGGKLAIYPNVSGETMSYEYISKNWIAVSGGPSTAATWANDNDTALIPERLVELSLMWRWKRAKGLDYAQEMDNFERSKESEVGSDRAASAVSLSLPNRGDMPDNFFGGYVGGGIPDNALAGDADNGVVILTGDVS